MNGRSVVCTACNRLLVSALLVSLTGALPGCSFLFVSPPPSNTGGLPSEEPVKCTKSKAAPVVDTVVTGLEAARVGFALAASDRTYDSAPISRTTDIALGLGLLALFATSATYGYVVTGKCVARNGGWNYVHNHSRDVDRQEEEEERAKPPPPASERPRH
ncbi:MAG: hypothetical protein ABI488_19175 [Polyangiaceae bacterium]